MKKVYIFSRPSIPQVQINGEEVGWKRLNPKWIHLITHSNELTLVYPDHHLHFNLSESSDFAVFRDELIPLHTCPNRILLLSDIDNTLFNKSAEANSAYNTFIRFWIENYEFNGSKLVYNTGRCLSEYNKNKNDFYEPDLLMSVLGNYAYKYDNDENIILQDSFPLFVDLFKDDEWDASEYYEDFKEHFPWMANCFISLDPYNIYFKIPRIENDERIDQIIKHVRNEDERKINGKIMKAKTILTSQGSKELWSFEIMPKFAGKGLAIKYAQWILGFLDCETFTAGDSLNDKDAFKIKVRGVIVGNAEQSLVQWYSKKQRSHLHYSNQNYALGIIDLLTTYNLHESFSTIYIYRPQVPNSQVYIDGEIQILKTFKNKWFYFQTNSNSFEIHSDTIKSFEIPVGGRYALYDSSFIPIKTNLSSILFVTDLDNTIFNDSEEGLEYYKNFIKFWVTFFEFNGSFLVYNTGRSMTDYLEDDQRLFKPDLILLCMSTFAYVLDDDLSFKEDFGLKAFNDSQKHDWDSALFTDALCEKFGLNREVVVRSYTYYIALKLEEKFAHQMFTEIKSFARNKDKKSMNGRVFHAKVLLIKRDLVNERFYEIRPLFVGKGIGLRYAQKKFSFTDENTFAAGDTANDIDLLKTRVNGIIMKNSEEMLFEWFRRKPRENLVITTENWALGLQLELEKKIFMINQG